MSKRRKRHKHSHVVAPAAATGATAAKPIKLTGKPTGKGDNNGGGGESGSQSESAEPQETEPQETELQETEPQEGSDTEEESPGFEFGYIPPAPQVTFPITSSHLINGRVRTASVCLTPNECKIIHCSSPNPHAQFGAEHVAARHRGTIVRIGTEQHIHKQITDLVKRARHGDQNAMAIIALTRENALKGHPRAVASIGMMKKFIDENPVKDDNTFAGEDDNQIITPDSTGAVMMANGPPLSNNRMMRIIIAIPVEDNRRLFAHGFSKWREQHETEHLQLASRLNELQTQIFRTGRTLGYARAIQRVRNPSIPIAAFDKKVAWELGE